MDKMDTSEMIHEYIRARVAGKGKQKVGVIVGFVYKGAICTGFSKTNLKAGDIFDKDEGILIARERALGLTSSPFIPPQLVVPMREFQMRCLKYFQQADYLMTGGSYINPCKCSERKTRLKTQEPITKKFDLDELLAKKGISVASFVETFM